MLCVLLAVCLVAYDTGRTVLVGPPRLVRRWSLSRHPGRRVRGKAVA